MAIRPVVTPNLPAAPRATARAETARAAQAAFFQAALAAEGTQAAAAPVRATATPVPPTPPVSRAAPTGGDSTSPTRMLRPGSLVDLKV